MKHNLLATTILTAACIWGRPAPAYGEGDPPTETVTPPATPAPLDLGAVDGDTPPDFSALDAKYGEGDPVKHDPPQAPKTDPPPPVPPETAKPAEKSPTDPAVAPVVPEIKPPDGEKPPDAQKKEFDPVEAEKAVKAAEIAPNASPKSREGFDTVKSAAQAAIKDNKELRKRLATLEETTGKLPENVEKELQELRDFKNIYGAESDPAFHKEWQDKLTAADDKLLTMLVNDPELRLPQADADEMRKAGFDTQAGRGMINDVLKKLHATGDMLLYEKVRNAVNARYSIHEQKEAKIAELRGKQGELGQRKTAQEQQAQQKFYGDMNNRMVELFKEVPWGTYKKEEGTPEEIAAAQKFNANLREKIVPAMQADIKAAESREPGKIAELVFRSQHLNVVQEENERLTTELEAANNRIAELTKTAAGVQRVSSPGKVDNAPPKGAETPATNYDQTAEEAADDYARKKGIIK